MGGFFGVVKREGCCVDELFYGVDYNSHLGTRRAGMATVNEGHFARSIHNIENTYFRTKFEGDLHEFSGKAGIGVISDTDAQPIIINCHLGKFAITTVGRINNIDELQKELLNRGHHFCEHSNDIVNPTELVAALICEGKNFVDGISNVHRRVKGSCSMLILISDGIIAARDFLGRTPIALACNGTDYAVGSETCAFANLGYELLRQLGPGEIVRISAENGVEVLREEAAEMQICAFLWTYYGYPPCEYEGRNVDEMRYDNGYLLGSDDEDDIDFVSPIPDSGTGMALGFSQAIGRPYKRGIVKYTPTWPRSFTPSTQQRRELVAKMKLIPNEALMRGKSVAFCDDSIVRGTQLRDNVADIRRCGAAKVHVRISCPPLIYPCEFLNFTSSKTEMELITRRCIAELEGEDGTRHLDEYADPTTERHKRMVDLIRLKLGLDTLRFNSLDNLVKSIGLPKCRICTHCFDGSSHTV